jgi:hypothetical protein
MRKIWLCAILLLTACGIPPRATPLPTPVVFRIAYTPSLQPLVKDLHFCAIAYPEILMTIAEVPTPDLDLRNADLILRFGGTPGKAYEATLRDESIVMIVNRDNPVLSLSTDQTRKIYTGRITRWAEVGGAQQPIQVWEYPDAEDIRLIFDSAIFPGENLTTKALLAPDPQAMLEAIADDPTAIGYIPQTWLAQSEQRSRIRAVDIDPKLAELLRQPFFALSSTEPEGLLRQFLGCVQSANP